MQHSVRPDSYILIRLVLLYIEIVIFTEMFRYLIFCYILAAFLVTYVVHFAQYNPEKSFVPQRDRICYEQLV